MTKIIICDMDGVLSESRTKASLKMINLIEKISKSNIFVIITGGNYNLIKYQIINHTSSKIHCLSQQGLVYHFENKLIYEEEMCDMIKLKIIYTVSNYLNEIQHKPITWDVIEDRGSQITMSALGRTASLEDKKLFDPNKSKRIKWKEYLQPKLKNIEIKIGGTTSLDFTMKGKDKGYGVNKFLEYRNLKKLDCIFLGDNLQEGGNDYPVKKYISNCIQVESIEDAYNKLKEMI